MNILVQFLEFLRSRSASTINARNAIAEIEALSIPEARRKALKLISDETRFHSGEGGISDNPFIGQLGPALQEFFADFEFVKEIGGEFMVSRAAVANSVLRDGFLKIGQDMDFAELVARPGQDPVFIVTDVDHPLDGSPTIYHHICLLS